MGLVALFSLNEGVVRAYTCPGGQVVRGSFGRTPNILCSNLTTATIKPLILEMLVPVCMAKFLIIFDKKVGSVNISILYSLVKL